MLVFLIVLTFAPSVAATGSKCQNRNTSGYPRGLIFHSLWCFGVCNFDDHTPGFVRRWWSVSSHGWQLAQWCCGSGAAGEGSLSIARGRIGCGRIDVLPVCCLGWCAVAEDRLARSSGAFFWWVIAFFAGRRVARGAKWTDSGGGWRRAEQGCFGRLGGRSAAGC